MLRKLSFQTEPKDEKREISNDAGEELCQGPTLTGASLSAQAA